MIEEMVQSILPFVSPLEVVLMIMLYLIWKDGSKYKDHERLRYDEYLNKLLDRMEKDSEDKVELVTTLETMNVKMESLCKAECERARGR